MLLILCLAFRMITFRDINLVFFFNNCLNKGLNEYDAVSLHENSSVF